MHTTVQIKKDISVNISINRFILVEDIERCLTFLNNEFVCCF